MLQYREKLLRDSLYPPEQDTLDQNRDASQPQNETCQSLSMNRYIYT